jgi:diguanylate cyclase (GGDEF)-like protein
MVYPPMEIPAIELFNYPRFHETSAAAIGLAAATLSTSAIVLVHEAPDGMTVLNDVSAASLHVSQGQVLDPSSDLAKAIRHAAQPGAVYTFPSARSQAQLDREFISTQVRLADGRLFGYIGAVRTGAAAFTSVHLTHLESIARLLGCAIDAELGSSHDRLTGLHNRNIFDDHLILEIARSRRNGTLLAVLAVGFAVPNDSPIQSGTWWMPRLAERLRTSMRQGDTIARMAACEFALLCPDLRHNESARRVAVAIVEAMRDPFEVHQKMVSISPWVGVAILPLDGIDPHELVWRASTAMTDVRESGTGGFRLFSEDCGLQLVR